MSKVRQLIGKHAEELHCLARILSWKQDPLKEVGLASEMKCGWNWPCKKERIPFRVRRERCKLCGQYYNMNLCNVFHSCFDYINHFCKARGEKLRMSLRGGIPWADCQAEKRNSSLSVVHCLQTKLSGLVHK